MRNLLNNSYAKRAASANRRGMKKAIRRGTPYKNCEEFIKRLFETTERCCYCGRYMPKDKKTLEHLVPISAGGGHVPYNLAIACASCNCDKNDDAQRMRRVNVALVGDEDGVSAERQQGAVAEGR